MKIDCSKEANFGDLLALLMTLIMLLSIVGILWLSSIRPFVSGFLAGALTVKWRPWIMVPLVTLLDNLWSSKLDKEKEQ